MHHIQDREWNGALVDINGIGEGRHENTDFGLWLTGFWAHIERNIFVEILTFDSHRIHCASEIIRDFEFEVGFPIAVI